MSQRSASIPRAAFEAFCSKEGDHKSERSLLMGIDVEAQPMEDPKPLCRPKVALLVGLTVLVLMTLLAFQPQSKSTSEVDEIQQKGDTYTTKNTFNIVSNSNNQKVDHGLAGIGVKQLKGCEGSSNHGNNGAGPVATDCCMFGNCTSAAAKPAPVIMPARQPAPAPVPGQLALPQAQPPGQLTMSQVQPPGQLTMSQVQPPGQLTMPQVQPPAQLAMPQVQPPYPYYPPVMTTAPPEHLLLGTTGRLQFMTYDLCMGVDKSDVRKGSPVHLMNCHENGKNVEWLLSADGRLHIKAAQSLCLDNTDHNFQNGNPLQLWNCLNDDQVLSIVDRPDAEVEQDGQHGFALQWRYHPEYYVDIKDGNPSLTRQLQIWSYGKNQVFTLLPK